MQICQLLQNYFLTTSFNLFVSPPLSLCVSQLLPKSLNGSSGSWAPIKFLNKSHILRVVLQNAVVVLLVVYFAGAKVNSRTLPQPKTLASPNKHLVPVLVSDEWKGSSSLSSVPAKNYITNLFFHCFYLKICNKLFSSMLLCSASLVAQTTYLSLKSILFVGKQLMGMMKTIPKVITNELKC